MAQRTVAVTGAAGHLGANLVRMLLAAGDAVRAVTLEPLTQDLPALAGLPVERVQADVTDRRQLRAALEGADAVYHLAGYISMSRRDAARMWRVNHEGARAVAATCRQVGVGRLVHVSSVQTLASAEVVDETSPSVAADAPAYDVSKLAGERAVLDEVARGLDAVVALPTAIVGPHDYGPSRAGRSLVTLWAGGMRVVTEGGHDWVDVRDVAHGLIAAERHAAAGRRFLLGGRWSSLRALASSAAAQAGHQGPRLTVPVNIARAVAPVAELAAHAARRDPWFTPAAVDSLTHHRHVDHGRAVAELAYRPRPLAQTLADTHNWWRAREYRPPHGHGDLVSATRVAEGGARG